MYIFEIIRRRLTTAFLFLLGAYRETTYNNTANTSKSLKINSSNTSLGSHAIVVVRKYGNFSSQYGSLYEGFAINNTSAFDLTFIKIFEGTEHATLSDDGSITLPQYSKITVLHRACDITIDVVS